jgi:hypothetical protein
VYCYTAYGLNVRSEFAFPELEVAENGSDVLIRLGTLNGLVRRSINERNAFLGETPNVGTFLVQDGCEIVVDPSPGVDEALLRTIILGPILAVLLRQRGLFVLHASSIAVHGAAVAFLGGSGYGKSTLAEAFYGRGYGIITDDLMAVHIGADRLWVFPGYPHVKLLPDTVCSLGYALAALPLLHSQTEKRVHYILSRLPQLSLPLKRLYVLASGPHNEIEPLQPQDAFVELTRNSRAIGLLRSPNFVMTHFHQCARLVEGVSICRLKRPSSLLALADTVRLVEEDLSSVSSSQR